MKIIYFGDGEWAQNSFDQIQAHGGFEIEKVILRFGSEDKVLRAKAEESGIEVLCPENVNQPDFIAQLASFKADLGVSMSYNQIIKKELLEIFSEGMINCHAGKLPNYRGRNVLNWALINGESEIGVTCHYIDDGVDTGDIIMQKTFRVEWSDDYGTVLKKAFALCADVLLESMEQIKNGTVHRVPQRGKGTYFIERKKGDEFIDWSWKSEHIYNFVRAITTPGPLARSWLEIQGKYVLIYIKEIQTVADATAYRCIEGGVIGKTETSAPLVKTGDTYVALTIYEIDHKTKKKLKIGDRLGLNQNLLMIKHNSEE